MCDVGVAGNMGGEEGLSRKVECAGELPKGDLGGGRQERTGAQGILGSDCRRKLEGGGAVKSQAH